MARIIFFLLGFCLAFSAGAVPLESGAPKVFPITIPGNPEITTDIESVHLGSDKPKEKSKEKDDEEHGNRGKHRGHAYGHHKHDQQVPEPATAMLFGTGLLGLAWIGRK